MTDLKKAAQQALDALKCLVETYEMGNTIRADITDAEESIASLKAALEQSEPCTYRCEAWPKCGCAAQSGGLAQRHRGDYAACVEVMA
jgi:hypothetical protein